MSLISLKWKSLEGSHAVSSLVCRLHNALQKCCYNKTFSASGSPTCLCTMACRWTFQTSEWTSIWPRWSLAWWRCRRAPSPCSPSTAPASSPSWLSWPWGAQPACWPSSSPTVGTQSALSADLVRYCPNICNLLGLSGVAKIEAFYGGLFYNQDYITN